MTRTCELSLEETIQKFEESRSPHKFENAEMLKMLNGWYAESESEKGKDNTVVEKEKVGTSDMLDRQNLTTQEKVWEVVEAIPFFIAVALLVFFFYNVSNFLSAHVS